MTMRYATWGCNISGGFLRSTASQETRGSYEFNLQLARIADELDYYAILLPVRFVGQLGGHSGGDGQLDPLSTAAGLAAATKNVRLISAVLPGFVPPATLAKIGSTIDHISRGRWHVNLVSGWFREEQEMFGVPWIDHDRRYQRSEEYLQVLKGLWQEAPFSFEGDFYQIKNAAMSPRPYQQPYPPIFQGGNSREAQEMAGKHADWYFMNGAPLPELEEQMRNIADIARQHGRQVRFAVNAFVIFAETDEEARAEFQEIVDLANTEAIEQFRRRAKEAKGMWSRSSDVSDFVANNEGFRTGLIGSYATVARKIAELEAAGIELVLLTFRYPLEQLKVFHSKVKPLVPLFREGKVPAVSDRSR